nr:fused MFS/spermidine synthase [Bacteriovorax sp. HI3]
MLNRVNAAFGLGLSLVFSAISCLIIQSYWLSKIQLLTSNAAMSFALSTTCFLSALAIGSFLSEKIILLIRKIKLNHFSTVEILIAATTVLTYILFHIFQNDLLIFRDVIRSYSASIFLATAMDFLIAFIIIFPSAFFMGCSLPVFFSTFKNKQAFFYNNAYALNCLGAAIGALLPYIVLLYFFPNINLIAVAVVFNAFSAFMAHRAFLQGDINSPFEEEFTNLKEDPSSHLSLPLLATISFATGFFYLAYEQIWFRFANIVFSSRIFSQSLTLAIVFLSLALSSILAKRIKPDFMTLLKSTLVIFALLCFFFLFSGFIYYYLSFDIIRADNLANNYAKKVMPLSFLFIFFFVFIPAILASLPFAQLLNILSRSSLKKTGHLFGWNTLGCVLGGLLCTYLLIPAIGSVPTLLLISILSLAGISLIGLPLLPRKWSLLGLAGVIALAMQLTYPFQFLRVGKTLSQKEDVYGLNSLVEIDQAKVILYNLAALVGPLTKNKRDETLAVQKKLATVPLAYTQSPHPQILVIGLGYGITTNQFLSLASQSQVTNIELLDFIAKTQDAFSDVNYSSHYNLRSKIIVNDGRIFLHNHHDLWDIISVNTEPYSTNASRLYSDTFYKLVTQRLKPDGIFSQHLFGTPELWKYTIATIKQSFKYVLLFKGYADDGPILIASNRPFAPNKGVLHEAGINPKEEDAFKRAQIDQFAQTHEEFIMTDENRRSEIMRKNFLDIFNRYPGDY